MYIKNFQEKKEDKKKGNLSRKASGQERLKKRHKRHFVGAKGVKKSVESVKITIWVFGKELTFGSFTVLKQTEKIK